MTCTCETDGHCHACRGGRTYLRQYTVEIEQVIEGDASDCINNAIACVDDDHWQGEPHVVVTERRCIGCEHRPSPCGACAVRPYNTKVYCHWCWMDITYRVQYTVGHYHADTKVCGRDCLCRPIKKEEHMSMSSKDYDALAEVLVHQRKRMGVNVYKALVREIGAMYAKDNPRFDARMWRKATRVETND